MDSQKTLFLSVVIPVYNSEASINNLWMRLSHVLGGLNTKCEVIFVDDGSRDESWDKLSKLHSDLISIKAVKLRRNFGVDSAILAGFRIASGAFVLTMDDDLQHAPEEIPRLLEKMQEGFDVVYGKFFRKKQTLFKNFCSDVHDRLARKVHRKPREIYLSPYKVIRREVIQEVVKYSFPYPYIDGLLLRASGRVGYVMMSHFKREIGVGNYGFFRSMKIFLNSVTTFSMLPLRCLFFLGCGIATLSLLWIGFKFMGHSLNAGTLTNGGIFFLAGVQLIAIGILGEYMGRAYMGLGNEPQYIIEDALSG